MQCDIVAGSVTYLKEGKTLIFNSERNAFQMAEIQHFFDIAEGRVENDSNVKISTQIKEIEASMGMRIKERTDSSSIRFKELKSLKYNQIMNKLNP